MAEVLHSRYLGWLKHANILEHSEPSMISGRKNIYINIAHGQRIPSDIARFFLSLFGQFCCSYARLDMCRSDFCRVMAMQCAWGRKFSVELSCQELVDRHFFLLRCQSPSCGRCDTPPHCAMAATAFCL